MADRKSVASKLKVTDARPERFGAARLAPDRRNPAPFEERQAAKVAHHRAAMAERGEKLVEKRQAAAMEFVQAKITPCRKHVIEKLGIEPGSIAEGEGDAARVGVVAELS